MIVFTQFTNPLLRVLLPLFTLLNLGWTEIRGQDAIQVPDHTAWTQLLEKYVDASGMVNYHGMRQVAEAVTEYLRYLETFTPDLDWSRNRYLAFYINLYNAGTVKLILDNYPVGSIRDIQNPWGQKLFTIHARSLSLDDVEHKILRSIQDPRIHFAINCASISCPKLQPKAFTESGLEKELNRSVNQFLSDSESLQIKDNTIYLSPIFKWYRQDFETAYGSLIHFLNNYLDVPFKDNSKIRFLSYNWDLNDWN